MSSPVFVLARKETAVALRGGTAWATLFATGALAFGLGAVLQRLSPALRGETAARIVEAILFATPLFAAAAAAGTFARERASGTLETLLAAPVSDAQVVTGKFLAAWILCTGATAALAALAAATASVPALAAASRLPPPEPGEGALLAAGIAAVATVQAAGIAAGMILSLAIRREAGAAAAAGAVAAAFAALASGEIPGAAPDGPLAHLNVVDFALGAADSRPLFFWLSLAALLLFGCVRFLESRRWLAKGRS